VLTKDFSRPWLPRLQQEHGHRLALDHRRCYRDPATRHAICEDYRAAAGIDLEHDEYDRDCRVLAPILILWGSQGAIGAL
jgi:haloacetate dehalogenase